MQKNNVIITIMFCFISGILVDSLAGNSFGLDLQIYNQFNKEKIDNENSETTEKNFNIYLRPFVIIPLNQRIDLTPFIYSGYNYDYNLNQAGNENEDKSMTAGGGCGVFFRIIDREIILFSLGPQISTGFSRPVDEEQKDNTFLISASLPVNIDFHLNETFSFRISSSLAQVSHRIHTQGNNNDEEKNYSTTLPSIKSFFTNPYFGFYLSL